MSLGWFGIPAQPDDETSIGVIDRCNSLLFQARVPAGEFERWVERQGYAIVQRTSWGHQAAIEPHDLVAIKLRWG